jgi:nitrate reductase cytochrome c-type subunit
MDDFNVSSLHESKNEWGARLITILTPLIIDGYKSILDEAIKLCKENGEMDKYLMTFQNFISRIPKWNQTIIETERKRICEKSGCSYLEDLVTCVHIIQLKILTAMRVGQKQKKVDINVPKLDDFIHKVYVNIARKVYKNVYLFEINIPPLNIQKNHRELEIIVQECILNTLRESIPVEAILKAYMDETVEEDVVEEIKEQIIEEKAKPIIQTPPVQSHNVQSQQINKNNNNRLSFNDVDYVSGGDGNIVPVTVPKTIENLENISNMRAEQRKMDDSDDEDENVKIKISNDPISLDEFDVHVIEEPKLELFPDLLIDAEVLD